MDEDIREEIDALADRYELPEGAAHALQALVRLADWRQPNFVPKSDPTLRRQADKPRPRAQQRRLAASQLAESLAGLELEQVRAARRVADVGTGAGFPGLVLAVGLPQARVALIEKRHEACRFLRRVTAEMGLDNVEVVEGKVQTWSAGVGACDLVSSRNVLGMDVMVKLTAPLLAPGGAVALWQGKRRNSAKEALAADAADAAGLRLAQLHRSEYRPGKKRARVRYLYLYQKVG